MFGGTVAQVAPRVVFYFPSPHLPSYLSFLSWAVGGPPAEVEMLPRCPPPFLFAQRMVCTVFLYEGPQIGVGTEMRLRR